MKLSTRVKLIVVLSVLILMLAGFAYAAFNLFLNGNPQQNALVGTIEGSGYANPEAAMKAYLDALKAADLDAMISTFAVETFVKNYDVKAHIERFRALLLQMSQISLVLPSNNKLTSDINVILRQGEIVRNIERQYMIVLMPNLASHVASHGDSPKIFQNEEDREAVIKTLYGQDNLKSLNSLEIIEFVPPDSLDSWGYSVEAIQAYYKRAADNSGADDVQSVVARVRIDGKRYLFYADTILYRGKWYMLALGGNIGNLLGISPFAAGVALE